MADEPQDVAALHREAANRRKEVRRLEADSTSDSQRMPWHLTASSRAPRSGARKAHRRSWPKRSPTARGYRFACKTTPLV